jgi:hypothetical protein
MSMGTAEGGHAVVAMKELSVTLFGVWLDRIASHGAISVKDTSCRGRFCGLLRPAPTAERGKRRTELASSYFWSQWSKSFRLRVHNLWYWKDGGASP